MYFCLNSKSWHLLSVLSITFLIHGCTSIPQGTPVIDEKPKGIETFPNTSSFPTDSCTYHIVARGETLAGIATRCGLGYKDVARWNKIPPPYMISPGQTLVLYGPAEEVPSPSASTNTSSVSSPLPSSTTSNPQEAGYHTVAPGDTLFNIAKYYGCTISDLRSWNNLASDSLSVGQRLKISGPPTNSTVNINTSPPPTTSQIVKTTTYGEKISGQHIVAHGDTLYSVAKLYGYSAADIAAWNGLQPPYNLTVGQILTVNPPASVASSPPKVSFNTKTSGEHMVVQGDTLYNIAKRYKCTIDELKSWNNLSNNEVTVGQRLLVSSKNIPTSLSPPSINTVQHEVHIGETMYSIATKYGVNPTDLAQLNGIGPPYTVYPGQKLTIVPKP